MHKLDMKKGLYQPRWRRMKEKPVAEHPHPTKKAPQQNEEKQTTWPAVVNVHRVDGLYPGGGVKVRRVP